MNQRVLPAILKAKAISAIATVWLAGACWLTFSGTSYAQTACKNSGSTGCNPAACAAVCGDPCPPCACNPYNGTTLCA